MKNDSRIGDLDFAYDRCDPFESLGTRVSSTDASGFVTGWREGGKTTSLVYEGSDLISVQAKGKATYACRY